MKIVIIDNSDFTVFSVFSVLKVFKVFKDFQNLQKKFIKIDENSLKFIEIYRN
jgi:hypothetical protein